jgi:hypothetical protein
VRGPSVPFHIPTEGLSLSWMREEHATSLNLLFDYITYIAYCISIQGSLKVIGRNAFNLVQTFCYQSSQNISKGNKTMKMPPFAKWRRVDLV